MHIVFRMLFICAAFASILASGEARALGAEATLVKILAADSTPEDPDLFEPDGDGIVDRAHFRLLDRVLADDTVPHHAEILEIWNANRAQVAEDNTLTFECTLLERLLRLTCDDFEVYGASQITIGDPVGNARIQRLLDTVGISVGLDNYDFSADIWLTADGDLDGDGFSNLDEYNAVCADFDAFVVAAIDPQTTPETLFCCGLCPLEFVDLPLGADKYVGEPLSLSVSVVNAEAPLQYTWLRNGDATGITSQTLSIAMLSTLDAGDYQCRVSDGGETITTPAASVRVAPHMRFAQQPQGAMLYRDEPLALAVAVEGGLSPLEYTWTRGDTIVGADSPSYTIASVGPGAAGTYQCSVADTREALASDPVAVVVGDHMAQSQQPQPQTVLVGGKASFTFGVSFGLGAKTFQWFHDGAPVGNASADLTLTGLSAADAGAYQCVARDAREELRSEIATLTIVDALTITREPIGARKLKGAGHTFSIESMGGLPPVTYRWFKDNTALNATAATLTLNALTLADAGSYWCVVSDAVASVESAHVSLEVFEALRITAQPEGASKLIGSAHTLAVSITGGGGGETYRWYKDDQPLDATSPSLVFEALALGDSGRYYCEITDEFSTIRTSVAVIDVALNLLITRQPAGASKYVGSAHTFSIEATGGLDTLAYRWLKDGFPTGNVTDTFTIASLSTEDTGNYQCEVTDGTETARSAVARLEVAEHLRILKQPKSARLLTGEELVLYVDIADGLGRRTFQWFHGDAPVASTSPVLHIIAVSLDDAGAYRCEISDDFETVVSESAEVVVANPLRFVRDPESAIRSLNEAITFEAATTGGLGSVAYRWERDGDVLNADTPTLSLTGLAKQDAGEYVCIAADERGEIRSAAAQLTVITPLVLNAPLDGITALAGQDIALSVSASGGDAPLHYQWFKEDAELAIDAPVLAFAPLRLEDAGEYRCVVSDGFQSVETNTAELIVLPRLEITQDPLDAVVTVGDEVTFEAAATGGVGEYRYAWFRNGEPVAGAGPRFTIVKATFLDAGAYTCAISDDFDTQTTAPATLTVKPVPTGILDVDPPNRTVIDFGDALLGQAVTRNVTLRNVGNAPLSYTLRVQGDSQFSAVAISSAPRLSPGEEITAQVTFQPIVAGSFSATLRIATDNALPVSILLRGVAESKGFWACGGGGENPMAAGDSVLVAALLAALVAARGGRRKWWAIQDSNL